MNARPLLSALVLMLAACATAPTMNAILSGWTGEHIDEVVRQWGYPNEERNFRGKLLYVWNDTSTVIVPAFSSATTTGGIRAQASPATGSVTVGGSQSTYGSSIGGGVVTQQCTRILEVDPNGIIKEGTYSGEGCCVMAIAGRCASWVNPRRPL